MAVKDNTLVIMLDEPQHHFAYRCRMLNLKQSQGLYGGIRTQRIFNSYRDDHDAIVGPIVGTRRYYDVTQYKFQSQRAQTCLNTGCKYGSIKSKGIV